VNRWALAPGLNSLAKSLKTQRSCNALRLINNPNVRVVAIETHTAPLLERIKRLFRFSTSAQSDVPNVRGIVLTLLAQLTNMANLLSFMVIMISDERFAKTIASR